MKDIIDCSYSFTIHYQFQGNRCYQCADQSGGASAYMFQKRIQNELRESLAQTEESMNQAHSARIEAEKMKEEAEMAKNDAETAKELAIKAKQEAEQAKNAALTDLDVMQKKTQFELISVIVKVALGVILGVGIISTTLYAIVLIKGVDNPIVSSTWSNLLGILLTNSFSIIGTIMGIKYATDKD